MRKNTQYLKVAVVTHARFAGPNSHWYEDENLKKALHKAGHLAEIVDWQNETIDWLSYDRIFLSSPWNIPYASRDFRAWLDRCESDGRKRLRNPRSVIDYGLIKDVYWADIISHQNDCGNLSASLVPSIFLRKNDYKNEILPDLLQNLHRQQPENDGLFVIKPLLSSDGYMTRLFSPAPDKREDQKECVTGVTDGAGFIRQILDQSDDLEGCIIQPYMTGIDQGEICLSYINGECVCCIRKPGGFKSSNTDARKLVAAENIPDDVLRLGAQLGEFLRWKFGPDHPVKHRLDVIYQDNRPVISEIELVEPNLNLATLEKYAGSSASRAIFRKLAACIIQGPGENHETRKTMLC